MAMMTLGDFFAAAPHALPVSAKPVTFTCMSKATGTLPGGGQNPHGRPIRARVTAAFVFLDGKQSQESRIAARRACREQLLASMTEDSIPETIEDGVFNIELAYQILQRALREWDPEERKCGAPMFPSVETMREYVVPYQADKLIGLFNDYVKAEHPEDAPDAKTFPEAKGGGAGVAGRKAR